MGSSIQWIVGFIRAGKNYVAYGDPYDFSCLIHVVGHIGFLVGGSREQTISSDINIDDILSLRGLKDELVARGVTEIHWTRIRSLGESDHQVVLLNRKIA